MKGKFAKRICAFLAALMLFALSLQTVGASQVFDYYNVKEPGSITLTVQIEDEETGEFKKIEDMYFDVYKIWDLNDDGEMVFMSPFTADDRISDNISAGDKRDLTDKYVEEAKGATAMDTVGSDAQGKITLSNLQFGGYLFIPIVDVEEDIIDETTGRKIGTAKYSAVPFFVSVPMLNGEGDYIEDVDATVKFTVSVVKEDIEYPVVKISKKSVAGEELAGAELAIYTQDATGRMVVAVDELTGQEARWISDGKIREVCLSPGIYQLVELAPPDNYYPAQQVYFRLNDDAEGTVDIVTDLTGRTIRENGVKDSDGKSILDNPSGRNVDAVVMVDEPKPTETPTPTPTETPTPTVQSDTETPTPPPSGPPPTNPPGRPPNTTRPVKTNDPSNIILWALLAAAAIALIVVVIITNKRKKAAEAAEGASGAAADISSDVEEKVEEVVETVTKDE